MRSEMWWKIGECGVRGLLNKSLMALKLIRTGEFIASLEGTAD